MSEYKDKIVSIYDSIHSSKNYSFEVDYITHIADRFSMKKKEVLDIGCGTGKHLEIFKERGYDFCGVDPSEDMIKEAKKRLGEDSNLICGYSDDVKEKYNLAISMFNVVNHVTGEYDNLEEFFTSISKCLTKKGILIFDCFNRSAFIKDAPRPFVKDLDNGSKLTVTPTADYDDSLLSLRCEYTKDNEKSFIYEINHKIWHTNTIVVALLKSGLSPLNIYKHFSNEEADSNDYKMIFVCKKVKAII